ncbi:MAG: hypothetical protein EOP47_28035 [Sphingobacteriaceae bacterium]|nr:MAG: hypothetical protein EOP47_28035 [Sphingobacteriaceae bacterium]
MASFLITSKLYLISFGILQVVIKIASTQLIKLSKQNTEQHIAAAAVYLKSVTIFVLLSGTCIFFLNEAFIEWWLGKEFYLGDGSNIVLFGAFIVTSINKAFRSFLLSNIELKAFKISDLVEGLLNLMLSCKS